MTPKSCLACAYYYHDDDELGTGDYQTHEWDAFSAKCHLNMWTIGFEENPFDHILERAYEDDRVTKLSAEKLEREFGDQYGPTKVPLSDGKWHDLKEYNCRHFFPKKDQGTMTLDKCREEQVAKQVEKLNALRFWTLAFLSGGALIIAIINL